MIQTSIVHSISHGVTVVYTMQSLNAFEFESHAGFSSKHPNKNIYFANGKSIYLVAQELKYTPLEKLFEAIENITNSPINQRNFRIWKGYTIFLSGFVVVGLK